MKSKNLTLVLFIIGIAGLALWGLMLWLTKSDAKPNGLFIHLGETGATLAVVTVMGGLVRKAFDGWEQEQRVKNEELAESDKENRQRQEFYNNILSDLKSVYDLVESCRLLVEAHRSAKTYGVEVRGLTSGVVTLHSIKRAMHADDELSKELKDPIQNMINFIKALLSEFRENYKRISHLQELDEEWNKQERERLAKTRKDPDEYTPLSRAWQEIQKLPKLTELRDDNNFDQYEAGFLVYLDQASLTLRQRLSVDKKIFG